MIIKLITWAFHRNRTFTAPAQEAVRGTLQVLCFNQRHTWHVVRRSWKLSTLKPNLFLLKPDAPYIYGLCGNIYLHLSDFTGKCWYIFQHHGAFGKRNTSGLCCPRLPGRVAEGQARRKVSTGQGVLARLWKLLFFSMFKPKPIGFGALVSTGYDLFLQVYL